MAQTALSPKIIEAIGSMTRVAVGVAGGTGTTTVVTIPQFSRVLAVIVSGATSTTAVYVDTVSTNTFTATHASGDLFTYVAFGDARI